MNFLAHFHLAWPDEGLIVGGLEGEFYKGPLAGDLPTGLARGIQLHRAIDAYTDGHEAMLTLRQQLPQTLRRFAGIVIDLAFDHYLSMHWQRFSNTPLTEFNHTVYATLQQHRSHLSPPAQQMLARLLEHDILGIYHHWHTVTATAERIGRRFDRGNPLTGLDRTLTPYRETLEQSFLKFYPELQSFAGIRIRAMADDDI